MVPTTVVVDVAATLMPVAKLAMTLLRMVGLALAPTLMPMPVAVALP